MRSAFSTALEPHCILHAIADPHDLAENLPLSRRHTLPVWRVMVPDIRPRRVYLITSYGSFKSLRL